jgi:GDPmannose 4,6-dehydratase
MAFTHVGLDYQDYLRVDEIFYRPAEVHLLMGDYRKGGKILGWKPIVSFRELVQMMVDADLVGLKHLLDQPNKLKKREKPNQPE